MLGKVGLCPRGVHSRLLCGRVALWFRGHFVVVAGRRACVVSVFVCVGHRARRYVCGAAGVGTKRFETWHDPSGSSPPTSATAATATAAATTASESAASAKSAANSAGNPD